MSDNNFFAPLRGGGRIWAVGAIHGEIGRLAAMHEKLAHRLEPGDQLVYLGDYMGWGADVRATLDEILLFRRAFIARRGVDMGDIVYLRGAQEEMWQKLLQLQFAPNPAEVLRWMAENGIGPTIQAYGGRLEEGLLAAREGVLSLTRWTGQLRQTMRNHDGHTQLIAALCHAAYADDTSLLFVHAGLDPSRPLSAQLDAFWWGSAAFELMEAPYGGFRLVVRGSDRRRGGIRFGALSACLDSGCGQGGPLTAACFGPEGTPLAVLET